MSNIGKQINNRSFTPIVTNVSYKELEEYRSNDVPLQTVNAFIISIPQSNPGVDDVNAASIWMTDEEGYLLNISKPNNMLEIRTVVKSITKNGTS